MRKLEAGQSSLGPAYPMKAEEVGVVIKSTCKHCLPLKAYHHRHEVDMPENIPSEVI